MSNALLIGGAGFIGSNLIAQLQQKGDILVSKFVYFSSGGTVYGNRRENVPFTETDNLAPISYYGWSKQMMENSILFMHRAQGLEKIRFS